MTPSPHSNTWFKPEPEWPVPESTTRDSLKTGIQLKAKLRIVARKQVNFQSYPMNDFRFDLLFFDPPEVPDMRTSYMRNFIPPLAPLCPFKGPPAELPDKLFNHKPVNDFQMDACINHKFMDDHMAILSEARKKINFFRQLRNKSFEF